jgi:hypothetical protein
MVDLKEGRYIKFYMYRYKQSTHKTAYTDACKTYLLDHSCTYNRLPVDEPSGSKHAEIKELNY